MLRKEEILEVACKQLLTEFNIVTLQKNGKFVVDKSEIIAQNPQKMVDKIENLLNVDIEVHHNKRISRSYDVGYRQVKFSIDFVKFESENPDLFPGLTTPIESIQVKERQLHIQFRSQPGMSGLVSTQRLMDIAEEFAEKHIDEPRSWRLHSIDFNDKSVYMEWKPRSSTWGKQK